MHTTDAQSVWKDIQEHMKSSSKRASEKRRLTQYVTNTVLDDNYKGTASQFVLHFNEQFRQLEKISEESEHFPPQIKLQLLQNAVRPINDLRIVETLDEFQSIITGYGRSSSLKYQTYYDLLINACFRYDRTKTANVAKRGYIYQNPFTTHNDDFIGQFPSETPVSDRLIHPVVNSTILTQINLAHLYLPDIHFNPDYSDQIQTQKQIHFQGSQPDRNGLVLYTCQDIYTNFRAKRQTMLYKNIM